MTTWQRAAEAALALSGTGIRDAFNAPPDRVGYTNGHAALIVPGNVDKIVYGTFRDDWDAKWWFRFEKSITLDAPVTAKFRVNGPDIGKRYLRLGRTLLDADIVRAWVVKPALAMGRAEVTCSLGGSGDELLPAVLSIGPATAVVMPMRSVYVGHCDADIFDKSHPAFDALKSRTEIRMEGEKRERALSEARRRLEEARASVSRYEAEVRRLSA